jgi:hypothetical protein
MFTFCINFAHLFSLIVQSVHLDIGLNDQGHAVISRKEGSSFVLKLTQPSLFGNSLISLSFFFSFQKYLNGF